MRSRVYEKVRCPSVWVSHSPAAGACGGFAAVGPAGGRYQLITPAVVCGGGQCHVVSVHRSLNADLLCERMVDNDNA